MSVGREGARAAQTTGPEQAMPKESATPDLIRCIVEAWSRRDIEAVMSFFAPDGLWDMSPMGMGTSGGASAIRQFCAEWWGGYDQYQIEAQEIVELSNGVAFVVTEQRGRPVGSSGFVGFRSAAVAIWRDGLLERVTSYTDLDEARAAAKRLAQDRG
jgi:hypothetical protein